MSKSAAHRVPPYKRPILIIGFLLILAVAVVITVLVFKNLHLGNDSTHVSNPNDSSSDERPDTTPDGTSRPSDDPAEPDDKAPQYEGEDPNTLGELTGDITYIDIDPDTAVLHSAVMLNQLLSESGQCVYNIKLNDVILRTASSVTTNDPSNSVCGPFDISVEGLSGTYQVEVIMTGDGKQGIITQDIQI